MPPQPQLSPDEFYANWRETQLNERQSYQLHFMDVCRLVGYETPTGSGTDHNGRRFEFETGVKKTTGTQGYADVFFEYHFAFEYKAPGKYDDLNEAYQQLLQYREKLHNPPLLVVTDIERWEIHTNWPNTEKKVYRFTHEDIKQRDSVRQWLNHLFYAPERLHPERNTEQVTAEAAQGFKIIADNMRDWHAEPERIAHFLTKIVFCLFAEDVSLLPSGRDGTQGVFSQIVYETRQDTERFIRYTHDLFEAMADGGDVLLQKIPYFNGSLFVDVTVEALSIEALTALERASRLNWASVEPSIFGTLFERSLDPAKRAQLGAHYTSRDDILLIVEPVLMQPLRRQWQDVQEQAQSIRQKLEQATTGRARTTHSNQLIALRDGLLDRLSNIKVLDPACGSGNFLYVALQSLMDMEKDIIKHELFSGLQEPFPQVHPRQMYGIEKDPIAHALASIVVWIGYIQWRQQNGYEGSIREKEPILEDLSENIVCRDAILAYDDAGNAIEPAWPAVDVIIGNPPFLGGSKLRGELGDTYYETLTQLYAGRVPGFADLVCYWFERARTEIEHHNRIRAGLLATNSIRGGANREVLKRIKETGDIFMAWSDREWVLEGAAVRVSMVGFDKGKQEERILDGLNVTSIHSDLTTSVDITKAMKISENKKICFRTDEKGGAFDIDADIARMMLDAKNETGVLNEDVVRPYYNALDITRNHRDMWVIDFGIDMPIETAAKYEMPFQHIEKYVKPVRANNRNRKERELWWIHRRPAPDMRKAVQQMKRYIVTPATAKYRTFVWINANVIPDHQLIAIARDDDYFFGVLHSKLHEVWSLRMGTSLEDRPRYTPTTTFETFPFPYPPGTEDFDHPHVQAISAAAQQLHAERDAWLNPPERDETGRKFTQRELKDRTLTNLYNALQKWRDPANYQGKTKAVADAFAPRLCALHDALDAAVCAAYGWSTDILHDEEAMLRHLLALNLERAGATSS